MRVIGKKEMELVEFALDIVFRDKSYSRIEEYRRDGYLRPSSEQVLTAELYLDRATKGMSREEIEKLAARVVRGKMSRVHHEIDLYLAIEAKIGGSA